MNQKSPHSIHDYIIGDHGILWFLGVFLTLIFLGAVTRLVFSEDKLMWLQFVKVYLAGLFLSIILFGIFYKKPWTGPDVMAIIILITSFVAEFLIVTLVDNGYRYAEIGLMGSLRALVGYVNNKLNGNQNAIGYENQFDEEEITGDNEASENYTESKEENHE